MNEPIKNPEALTVIQVICWTLGVIVAIGGFVAWKVTQSRTDEAAKVAEAPWKAMIAKKAAAVARKEQLDQNRYQAHRETKDAAGRLVRCQKAYHDDDFMVRCAPEVTRFEQTELAFKRAERAEFEERH